MSKYEYYKLCAKAASGQIAVEEERKLKQWLNSSQENKAYYEDIAKVWNMTEAPPVTGMPDADEGWSVIEQTLGLKTTPVVTKNRNKAFPDLLNRLTHLMQPKYRPAVYSFATVLILAIGFVLIRNQISATRLQKIATYNRQKMQITLSDGSEIHLNSGSSLKFHKHFTGSVREVILAGEAFFKVTHDDRPFVVITDNARTTVLGTQFNVRSRNNATCVIVQQGRVGLSSTTMPDRDVIVSMGQMSQVSGNEPPPPVENVDVDYLLGWLEDKLVFEKTPLKEILEELERYYDINIESVNPELNEKTITATFENWPIETVLSSICLTLDTKFEYKNDIYRIMDKP